MTPEPQIEELLDFFKAMADANRLKIVGILAQQPSTVEQLAAMLELQASTVSHHLARLTQVGLVSARADSYYNVYRLETDALEAMAQRMLARETLPAVAADVDLDAFDRKVLRDFTGPDGRLKSLPAQRKKLEAVCATPSSASSSTHATTSGRSTRSSRSCMRIRRPCAAG